MFHIIENYKKLFIATLRSQQVGGPGEQVLGIDDIKDENANGSSLDELLQHYRQDKRIDRKELGQLGKDLDKVAGETKEYLSSFMKSMYIEMLKDGITIKSGTEIANLRDVLSKIGIETTAFKRLSDKADEANRKGEYFSIYGKKGKDGKYRLEKEGAFTFDFNNDYVDTQEINNSKATATKEATQDLEESLQLDMDSIDSKIEEYNNLTFSQLADGLSVVLKNVKKYTPEEINHLKGSEEGKGVKILKILEDSKKEINDYNNVIDSANTKFKQELLDTYNSIKIVALLPGADKAGIDSILKKIDNPETLDLKTLKEAGSKLQEQKVKIESANTAYKETLFSDYNIGVKKLIPGLSIEGLADLEAQPFELKTVEDINGDNIVSVKNYIAGLEAYNNKIEAENQKYEGAEKFYAKYVKATPEEIIKIQKALGVKESGKFDMSTYQSIIDFQEKSGFTKKNIDGKAGGFTLSKLFGKAIATDEYYSVRKKLKKAEKKTEKTELVKKVENLNISKLNGLKRVLRSKKLAVVDGEYFFIPKKEINDLDAFKKNLEKEGAKEKNLSVEEVLKKIKDTSEIELAIDGWFLNESLNEAEKLTLVLAALDMKDAKVFDVNTGKDLDAPIERNDFPILDVPSSDFKNGVFNKEKFEKNLIKAINKQISKIPKTKGEELDKKQQKQLTNEVNKILKEYGITKLKGSDIITKKAFFTDTAKVSDLIKDKNIFESIIPKGIIEMKGGLYIGVPDIKRIDDKAIYKIVQGDEAAVLSGAKLKEVLKSNDTYEEKTLSDDKREFEYSQIQKNKDKIEEKKQKQEQKEQDKINKEKAEQIEEAIGDPSFSIKDLLGVSYEDIVGDSPEAKWITTFSMDDQEKRFIPLKIKDVEVDGDKAIVEFNFDDDEYILGNAEANSNIKVQLDTKKFTEKNSKRGLKDFKKEVIKAAKISKDNYVKSLETQKEEV